MADDNFRNYRAKDSYARPGEGAVAGNDPLAELARLIGQTDQFSEFRRLSGTQQQQPARPGAAQNYGTESYGVPSQHGEPRYDAPPLSAQPPQYGAPSFAAAAHGPYQRGFENPPPEQPPYDNAYYQDGATSASHDIYDDEPPARRRISVLALAGIFALAVLGTAGAFGYRALFGTSGSSPPPVIRADTTPTKIVPAPSTASNKQITDRVGDRPGQGERLVSREEQPIDLKDKAPPPIFPNASAANSANLPASPLAASNATPAGLGEPKKVRTIPIRPDQLTGAPEATSTTAPPPARSAAPAPNTAKSGPPPRAAADADDSRSGPTPIRPTPNRQAAAPAVAANAPLSLNPDAEPSPATPAPARSAARTPRAAPPAAAAAPADAAGSYLVQLSSQRSEADAQSAFRALQGKFPAQLGSRSAVIRRADLGDKGTYYRAMVGPFASGSEANELCSSLKSAGGSCIIQRN